MTKIYTQDELENIAEKTRLSVLEADGIPVDLISIAKKQGYDVYNISTDEPNVSGLVDYNKKVIGVCKTDSDLRKRFTIGHEIGHIVLDHQEQGMHVDRRTHITSEKESQANYFSGALLMPKNYFIKAYTTLGGDLAAVAKIFDVSEAAAAVRASILGLTNG